MTTAGVFTLYTTPTGLESGPQGIVAGPAGDLWFTEEYAGNIGRVTTSGTITEYPTYGAGPNSITIGPKGAPWYAGGYPAIDAIGEVFLSTATLAVSQSNVAPGAPVTLTGSGFGPSESIKLYADGTPGLSLVRSVISDAAGSFSLSSEIAAVPYGANELIGTGQSSGKVGAAVYNVKPRLTITPSAGPAGSTATIHGYGYPYNAPVYVYLSDQDIDLGEAFPDVNGSFTLSITIPSGLPPGVAVINGGYPRRTYKAATEFTVE